MLDGQVAILENATARYAATGEIPTPLGSRHPSITPFEAFKTKDDWLILAVGNDKLWKAFCKAVDREEWLDDHDFATNDKRNLSHYRLKPMIDELMVERTTSEWMDLLTSANVPASPINTMADLFTDPQVASRNMLVEVDQPGVGPIKVAGNPIKLSTVDPEDEIPSDPAPSIGEHTEEILKNYLSFDSEKIEKYLKTVK